jgi:isoquinoline 1-oxidoreductase alpha subunit
MVEESMIPDEIAFPYVFLTTGRRGVEPPKPLIPETSDGTLRLLTARPGVCMPFTLSVNGQSRTVDVPENMPLLWVLRDILSLKSTKFGCGIGQCGACTVHVNGIALRSCQTPIANISGRSITTLEGLSGDGTHPVQQAWQEVDVPQCGYCQPGQMMSAAALLDRTPEPTDSDVDTAMNGNICRCGTYLRIRQAIHRASQIAQRG